MACIFIGFILILAVYAIPTAQIESNVQSSADTIVKEGAYPCWRNIFGNNFLDKYSDTMMLLVASYSSDENLLERSMLAKRAYIEEKNPVDALKAKYMDNEPVTYKPYSRYWHGYLVYLKPLLCAFTYSQILFINGCLVTLIAVWLVVLMYRKNMRRYIIPYLFALSLINPISIGQTMQYSTIYYIYSIATILFLLNKERFLASKEKFLLYFVIIGCMTSYLDLLSYPFVTFGIPITFYVCVSKENYKKVFNVVVLALVAWGVGYVGMWIGKWILGTLLSSQNVLSDALQQVQFRSSMYATPHREVIDTTFSMVDVIYKNLYTFIITKWWLIALFGVYMLLLITKIERKGLKDYLWVVLIFICILPIIWYMGASNHSYMHAWLTFRELMISAFAVMCLLSRYSTPITSEK